MNNRPAADFLASASSGGWPAISQDKSQDIDPAHGPRALGVFEWYPLDGPDISLHAFAELERRSRISCLLRKLEELELERARSMACESLPDLPYFPALFDETGFGCNFKDTTLDLNLAYVKTFANVLQPQDVVCHKTRRAKVYIPTLGLFDPEDPVDALSILFWRMKMDDPYEADPEIDALCVLFQRMKMDDPYVVCEDNASCSQAADLADMDSNTMDDGTLCDSDSVDTTLAEGSSSEEFLQAFDQAPPPGLDIWMSGPACDDPGRWATWVGSSYVQEEISMSSFDDTALAQPSVSTSASAQAEFSSLDADTQATHNAHLSALLASLQNRPMDDQGLVVSESNEATESATQSPALVRGDSLRSSPLAGPAVLDGLLSRLRTSELLRAMFSGPSAGATSSSGPSTVPSTLTRRLPLGLVDSNRSSASTSEKSSIKGLKTGAKTKREASKFQRKRL
ncbi:hypothetical protein HGRIS_004807 [Hohenbuehelia grisea]|uniref:Uncharacterized protein n=1 Tax=Hohenbuehelia grisea TaxID=104357 RepID=A0ABR3JD12_9AGAR